MEQRDIFLIAQRLFPYFKWSSPAKYQLCWEGWGLIEIQNMGPKVGLQMQDWVQDERSDVQDFYLWFAAVKSFTGERFK